MLSSVVIFVNISAVAQIIFFKLFILFVTYTNIKMYIDVVVVVVNLAFLLLHFYEILKQNS